MKIIAKDLKEWWSLPDWPKDQYIDDDAYRVNGVEVENFDVTALDDSDEVEILCGSIINDDSGKDLRRAIRAWLKTRTHVTIVASVPKERETKALAYLKALARPSGVPCHKETRS